MSETYTLKEEELCNTAGQYYCCGHVSTELVMYKYSPCQCVCQFCDLLLLKVAVVTPGNKLKLSGLSCIHASVVQFCHAFYKMER